jgi:hypothetical protein
MVHFFKKASFLLMASALLTAGILFCGDVIQTQESDSWEGVEVDLVSLKIRNNIITMRFKLRNAGSEKQSGQIYFEGCYIMDEVNRKKHYPLKDADGIYIAGPMTQSGHRGGRFIFDLQPGKSRSMWIKFPEPTDNPATITISVPGVFPFEEVELNK